MRGSNIKPGDKDAKPALGPVTKKILEQRSPASQVRAPRSGVGKMTPEDQTMLDKINAKRKEKGQPALTHFT